MDLGTLVVLVNQTFHPLHKLVKDYFLNQALNNVINKIISHPTLQSFKFEIALWTLQTNFSLTFAPTFKLYFCLHNLRIYLQTTKLLHLHTILYKLWDTRTQPLTLCTTLCTLKNTLSCAFNAFLQIFSKRILGEAFQQNTQFSFHIYIQTLLVWCLYKINVHLSNSSRMAFNLKGLLYLKISIYVTDSM